MNEDFGLPVSYRGEELLLNARFQVTGYTYRIEVEAAGQWFIFEPDEERNWRALVQPGGKEESRSVDTGLLEAIAGSIEEITKG